MLLIWTSAKSDQVAKTFGAALKNLRPNIPAHHFIPLAIDGTAPPYPDVGDVLLVAGNKCLDVLKALGVVPKNRTLGSLRDKPFKFGNGHALVTLDPIVVTSTPQDQELLEWDVRLATRMMLTGSPEPILGKYQWVPNFDDLLKRIEALYEETGKPVDLSLDLETMGFYPWYPGKDIVSISFTLEAGTADVLYLGPMAGATTVVAGCNMSIFDQIEWLLTSKRIKLRLANGKFDLIWIAEKWGIECTNFTFDSMLVGSLLNENRSNSLNMHAKVYTDLGGYDDKFNSSLDKSHMEAIPPALLLPYAGGDTDATQQVSSLMRQDLLADQALTTFYIRILHPAARAFEKIERRGVCVDVEKFQVLKTDLDKVIKDSQELALDLLPNKMKVKFRDRIADQLADGKSPMLPSILKEYFFSSHGLDLKPKEVTEKTGEPSLAKSHLRQFADDPEAKAMVSALTDMDTASKTRSTFVDGFLAHLRPDGRIHPTYYLAHAEFEGKSDESGTVTGRLSAKDPAFQIIPKKTKWAKRIRECYPAPPGKIVLSCDYSQGELKVVACLAPEKTMLQSYLDGLDLHAVTGASLAGVPLAKFMSWKDIEDETLAAAYEKFRSNAKPCNFGLLYGMSATGYQGYAWAAYGLKMTDKEAEDTRNAFFKLYSGLPDYHARQKKLVGLHEAVRSPLGRIRHLPTIRSWDRAMKSQAERQAINAPVQSCLSDMMIWAIALIEDAYPGGEIEIVGMIHDALIAYIPEQDADLWAGRVTDIMANLPFHEVGWQPQLKFTADAEAGYNLATMKKLKLSA